jgi:protein-S-isoprenylcysteine O-methyltransferase Ste14
LSFVDKIKSRKKRHPGHSRNVIDPIIKYLSLILLCLGAGFATLNLQLTGFALFVPAPVQFLRARKEEDLFVKHFGTAYTAYRKKTPMIVPGWFR